MNECFFFVYVCMYACVFRARSLVEAFSFSKLFLCGWVVVKSVKQERAERETGGGCVDVGDLLGVGGRNVCVWAGMGGGKSG